MRIIKLKIFRFRCSCTPVTVNWLLSLFHHFFAIFKNIVHRFGALWDAELLGVSPGSKLCTTFLNISTHFKPVAVRWRLIFQFTYVQYCILCRYGNKSRIRLIIVYGMTLRSDGLAKGRNDNGGLTEMGNTYNDMAPAPTTSSERGLTINLIIIPRFIFQC